MYSRICSDVKYNDYNNNNDNIISDYITIDWSELHDDLVQLLQVDMEYNVHVMDVKAVWTGMYVRATNDCS